MNLQQLSERLPPSSSLRDFLDTLGSLGDDAEFRLARADTGENFLTGYFTGCMFTLYESEPQKFVISISGEFNDIPSQKVLDILNLFRTI